MIISPINTGYRIPSCFKSKSSIKRVVMMDWDNIDTDVPYHYNADGQIEVISTSSVYYDFQTVPQTTDYQERFQFDSKTGLFWFEGKFEIMFHKNKSLLRSQLLKFIYSPRVSIQFLDSNDRWWIVGKNFGCRLEDGNTTPGKKYSDFDGQKLIFLTKCSEPMQETLPTGFGIDYSYPPGTD